MKLIHIILVFLVLLLVIYLIHEKREHACDDLLSQMTCEYEVCTECEPTTHKCINLQSIYILFKS